jgi:hypothetical protein
MSRLESRTRVRRDTRKEWVSQDQPDSLFDILGRIIRMTTIVGLGLAAIWFFSGRMLIGGVPSSVILTFLQDRPALNAYFQNDDQGLHDRLNELGVEEQIKDYYRPQIPDEAKLDQFIHQVFYNRTGYVGEAYEVSEQGRLRLKRR